MSARRVSTQVVGLPQNPQFLNFERSDGDASRWPSNTTEVVDDAGEVNFMKPVAIDSSIAMRWRLGVAQGVAAATKMPASPSYVLSDWPVGYALYDHHKGPQNNPRHDLYLFGAPARRYRSINEFIPHAIWLYEDVSTNVSNCLCKYCQKKPQKEVSASFVPGVLRTSSNTPTPSRQKPARSKGLRETALKSSHKEVYANVQRIPAPVKSSNIHRKTTMLVERNSDLRATVSNTSMTLRRLFRSGEMLWCSLDPPIKGSNNVIIEFWPGLVDEVKLKSVPVPATEETDAPNTANKDRDHISWSVRQSFEYRIQLLAVNRSCMIPNHMVLPYQAHVPPDELILAMKAFPSERLNFDRDVLARFNPYGNPQFEDAVAPLAMALQIGSELSAFWSLTDEWAFDYHPSFARILPSPPSTASAAVVSVAPHAQDQVSSAPDPVGPSSIDPFQPAPGANMEASSSEVQRVSVRILGRSENSSYMQMRYQGLWWGGERIWVDDLVRLKVSRRCIAPKGEQHILPPSGPGKSAREVWNNTQLESSELGAGPRGIFMRVDALFIADNVLSDGNTQKECRVSGMVYELADVDWVDPNANTSGQTISSRPQTTATGPAAFVPAPSPLHPHIGSNADGNSANPPQVTSASAWPLQNTLLTKPHYHLPEAPEGFFFRPILSEGYEAVFSLSLVSGRYYPRILSHPLLKPAVERAQSIPLEDGGVLKRNDLWALEGLSSGFYNSVDPVSYRLSRKKMIEEADLIARRELEVHKQKQIGATQEVDEDMDQDLDRLAPSYVMDVDQ